MVNYTCYRCGYSNNNKSNIIRHIGRKNTCYSKLNIISLDDCKQYILNGLSYEEYLETIKCQQKNNNNTSSIQQKNNKMSTKGEYKCKFCEKILTYKQSYYRHLKTCKEKKQDDEVKESMTELVNLLNKKLENKDKE